MGQISILTPYQKTILSEFSKSDFLKKNFYFTGGTVLNEYYLKHRHSDDLDFFSEKKFDTQVIFTLMEEWSKKLKFSFQSNFAEITYIFNLTFKDGQDLKVDFSFYPYKRLESGKLTDGIEIDSLFDIAVNKLLVVTQRTEVKDFVDLYFLLKTFTVSDLMVGVKKKFNVELDPFIIAADFLKIEDFDYLPKMIKPLKLKELIEFYRGLSKKLGKKYLE